MDKTVVLKWAFSPTNYFETSFSIKNDRYEMNIDEGRVEARIKADENEENLDIRNFFHESLNARFLGVQLLSHKPFNLPKPSFYILRGDGQEDPIIFAEAAKTVAVAPLPDLISIDQNGKILSDTRSERISQKKQLSELIEKHINDPVLEALVDSYHAAVMDPDNELVHLYEIRDGLNDIFKSEETAILTFSINPTMWKRLGILANTEPLKQGRHRGWHVGTLRDATEGELNEARTIARYLIEKYLSYLEGDSSH